MTEERRTLTAEEILALPDPEPMYYHYKEQDRRRAFYCGFRACLEAMQRTTDRRQVQSYLEDVIFEWAFREEIPDQFWQDRYHPPDFIPWQKLRKMAFKKYGRRCVYCGAKATHIDHLVPVSRGGTYSIENLRPSCKDCNLKKLDKTLLEFLHVAHESRFYPDEQANIAYAIQLWGEQ